MIVGSIDLMGGQAVQLVGGEKLAVEAGDPAPIATRFGIAGEVALIDLDAAMGQGSNAAKIRQTLSLARCRVGGGIRDVDTAIDWLDAGAHKVILGTAAKPEVLKHLPRGRVIAALDAIDGEVVVEGWKTRTGASILERMKELRPYVSGFLVTFVEREGRMHGTDMERVHTLVEAAGSASLTIAGGVTTAEEVAELDRLGVDAQVGMALYTEKLHIGEALCACLKSDRPDGLWPTVVCNERGQAMGLAYSDLESVRVAIDRQRGAYHSRRRGLWVKGETSGNHQDLLRIDVDCDRDALRFIVRQHGDGFCHLDTDTCFGDLEGMEAMYDTVRARVDSAPKGSYTRRLLDDPELLEAKLVEEARELAHAVGHDDVSWEAADLIYFAAVAMARAGVDFSNVDTHLNRRALKVTRRSNATEQE